MVQETPKRVNNPSPKSGTNCIPKGTLNFDLFLFLDLGGWIFTLQPEGKLEGQGANEASSSHLDALPSGYVKIAIENDHL